MRMLPVQVLVAACGIAAMPVAAQAQDACEPFSAVTPHGSQVRTYVDHLDEGQSIGDQHIATGPVHNEAGDVIGHFEAISVVTHLHDDGTPRAHADVAAHFPEGVIVYKVLSAPNVRSVDDTSGPHLSTEAVRLITGGSGVFEGATGTIELTRRDGQTVSIVNISCP